MNGWISVKDRLPETTEDVLASDGYGYVVAYCKDKKYWDVTEDMIRASNYDGGASLYLDTTILYWRPIDQIVLPENG